MGKIAFVFSGQGAQYPGMGKDLYENSDTARAVLDSFEAIHPGLLSLMFSSSEEELKKTANTQIALYSVISKEIKMEAAAGFSLGEIPALAASGVLSREDGFHLTEKRGSLMQSAAEGKDAAMLAVVKLSDEDVESVASLFKEAYPVNYNSPGQVVVSIASDEAQEFSAKIKEKGGRALKLSVSGGFHSPFMKEAAEAFRSVLDDFSFAEGNNPIWSNVTARKYEGSVKDILSQQISSPVRWKDEILDMKNNGFDSFIEIGPGRTLSDLIRRISPELKVYTTENPEGIEKTIGEIRNG